MEAISGMDSSLPARSPLLQITRYYECFAIQSRGCGGFQFGALLLGFGASAVRPLKRIYIAHGYWERHGTAVPWCSW